MSHLLGAVLVGGHGRRMGRPKDSVPVGNRTMMARAWNALAPVADPVVAQGASEGVPGPEPSPDLRSGSGPLGGISAALHRAKGLGRDGIAVLAVDLPRVPASLLLALAERWRGLEAPEEAAVVLAEDGKLQPLAGIYGAGLAESVDRWLDHDGDRAVHAWIEHLGDRSVRVDVDGLARAVGHGDPLLNVNRPEDAALAERLPPPAPPMISVVGWKDAGKTSVAVALVRALRTRGWRVMALKHGHGFRLDHPGTDSHRLRCEGGAERVVLSGPEEIALLGRRGAASEPGAPELAARYLPEADVVVVEGWKGVSLPAIEAVGPSGPPLWHPGAPDRDRFLARIVPGGPGGAEGPVHPVTLDRDGPELGRELAHLVEARVIPGWRR